MVFHDSFLDSASLSPRIIHILEKRDKMRILAIKQAFQWNYTTSHGFESLPEELKVSKEMIYEDSVVLSIGMVEYAILLHMDMYLKSYALTVKSDSPRKYPKTKEQKRLI